MPTARRSDPRHCQTPRPACSPSSRGKLSQRTLTSRIRSSLPRRARPARHRRSPSTGSGSRPDRRAALLVDEDTRRVRGVRSLGEIDIVRAVDDLESGPARAALDDQDERGAPGGVVGVCWLFSQDDNLPLCAALVTRLAGDGTIQANRRAGGREALARRLDRREVLAHGERCRAWQRPRRCRRELRETIADRPSDCVPSSLRTEKQDALHSHGPCDMRIS